MIHTKHSTDPISFKAQFQCFNLNKKLYSYSFFSLEFQLLSCADKNSVINLKRSFVLFETVFFPTNFHLLPGNVLASVTGSSLVIFPSSCPWSSHLRTEPLSVITLIGNFQSMHGTWILMLAVLCIKVSRLTNLNTKIQL